MFVTQKAHQINLINNEQFSSLDFPKMQFILGTSNVSVSFLFLLSVLPKGTELAMLTEGCISSLSNVKIGKKQVCFVFLFLECLCIVVQTQFTERT